MKTILTAVLQGFHINDRVLACWSDCRFYPAKVTSVNKDGKDSWFCHTQQSCISNCAGTSFRWGDTTAVKICIFSYVFQSVINFFNLLPFLREKSFLLGYLVSTCFKYICGKSFLNLLLLLINRNEAYCQSCRIPLKISQKGWGNCE